jgi:hypothetical protein
MKKIFIVILFCSCSVAFGLATFSYFPQHVGKKMEKAVKKAFGKEASFYSIETPDSLKLSHEVYSVFHHDTLSGYVMVTRALGCQMGGCDVTPTDTLAFEQFFFMTAFNAKKDIKQVKVLEYTSNHGYEISSKSWLKQFTKDTSFEVGKNIDGISGATVSVNSITNNVNKQCEIINALK